jgi:hypothetical protein
MDGMVDTNMETSDIKEERQVLIGGKPFMVAGGIDLSNIKEALQIPAYAVDLSGGRGDRRGQGPGEDKETCRSGKIIRKIKTKQKLCLQQQTEYECYDKYFYRKDEKMAESDISKGRFGIHGGQYIPETLMNAVIELENVYNRYKDDPQFKAELEELLNEYAGRPSRLYYAAHATEKLGGAKIYLKREDLNHTGSHKINNVLGQCLLAKKMGKTRVIAETGRRSARRCDSDSCRAHGA